MLHKRIYQYISIINQRADMEQLLQLFILLPLFTFIISVFLPFKNERLISTVTIGSVGLHLIGILIFIIYWLLNGFLTLDIKHFVLYKAETIEIFIDFFFDKITAVFALVGSLLTFLVLIFSRYYLHRDEGFKRYFSTINLFFLGYNFAIFSGNFETLFIGWEVLGICSFLLIAFYRDRYLPVKNSLKVISLYRLGDICLILSMWMSHHLWHKNITFLELGDTQAVQEHLFAHNWYSVFMASMICVAAAAKSAQLPFSSWLPRAMEGPTTSSAIFYGSLSVHLGVFLLLRTYPYWESLTLVKATVVFMGICTSLIATSIARVQSTVKTQIAYASISQIGLMFVEVAWGFHIIALIHFAGNAFLRTYQLLVSPSVLSYLIHDMFFSYTTPQYRTDKSVFNKIKNTIYMLSIKEWHLDTLLYQVLWQPFKWVGKRLQFLSHRVAIVFLIVIYVIGLFCNLFQEKIPVFIFELLPFVFSFIGLLLVLKAFTERGSAIYALFFIIGGKLCITLSIALLNEEFGFSHITTYLSGSLICAVIVYLCFKKLKEVDSDISLNQFHGHSYEHPNISMTLLVACLGLVGLPFTPTFIGIDVLFSHIHKHEELIILFTTLSFVFIEISILRMYARVCWGQHQKAYHPIAYRSS